MGVLLSVTGTIRWWNCDRGFGFVEVEGQADVFVHHLALDEERDFSRGDEITFDVIPGQVGSVAANVRVK